VCERERERGVVAPVAPVALIILVALVTLVPEPRAG